MKFDPLLSGNDLKMIVNRPVGNDPITISHVSNNFLCNPVGESAIAPISNAEFEYTRKGENETKQPE